MFHVPASLLPIAAAAPALALSPQFTEVGLPAGLDFVHEGPVSFTEARFMSGGGTVGDFNNDGWQDVFVLGTGNRPDALFINNADGTFTDQAPAWGIARNHLGFGAAAADYDNDGDLDLYVTSHSADGETPTRATGHHRLYRNNGDQTFTDVAGAAGVNQTSTIVSDGFGASFGDYNLDGHLDLAVAGWFANNDGNRLFMNNGDGTFTDATQQAGLQSLTGVNGFSPRFLDTDNDRFPELVWTSDFETSRYFINNTDGTFTDATVSAGVNLESNGMGVTIADFNNDGLMDWYATSIDRAVVFPPRPQGDGNMLYINNGDHTFTEISDGAGVSAGWWGWGTDAVDFDQDGNLDIAETNGWLYEPWVAKPSCMWVGNPDGTFSESAVSTGFTHIDEGRGLVTLDYDNDGDRDAIIFTAGGRPHLFRNDTDAGNWLTVELNTTGTPMAPHGVGARIAVTTGSTTRTGEIQAGTTYLAQSELSAHFGLGNETLVDQILVTWTDGSTTSLAGVQPNQRLLIEPDQLCPADINDDGVASPADFTAWLGCFTNPAGASYCSRADVNASGAIDPADFTAWLAAFNAGCP